MKFKDLLKQSPMLLLFAAAAVIVMLVVSDNYKLALAFSAIPAVVLLGLLCIERKDIAFITLLVVDYFIPLVMRYMPNKPVGVLMDGMIVVNLFVILCHILSHKEVRISNLSFDAVVIVGFWLLYCIIEVFNPKTVSVKVWFTHIRNMALYMLMIIMLSQIMIDSFKQVKAIIIALSVLTVIAVVKAVIQKYVGFDAAERYFLYVMDGQRTHFLSSGIRYFSFFTDASNFGAQMGFAAVVMICGSRSFENRAVRIYLSVVSALAIYGLLISGTRSAIVIPFIGLTAYIFMAGRIKDSIILAICLGAAFYFLAGTNIGQGNAVIRRARSAFSAQEDESYLVRQRNREKLKPLMAELPMGNGLGMSGGRGRNYGHSSAIDDIPTDSWFVQLWVETGIIGLLQYMAMMAYLFIRGAYVIRFKSKDRSVQGLCGAMLGGVIGLFAMSSNNEVFSQYPNSILAYAFIGLAFSCVRLSEQETRRKEEEKKEAEKYQLKSERQYAEL